jgi:hypothetical protein
MTTTMTPPMAPPEPTLQRTDFVGWQRETLEQLTLQLMTENARLRADLRMLLDAHRAAVVLRQGCWPMEVSP